MKVIGAGFGRTGTTSMQAALNQLGLGPCHHMAELFAHPVQIRGWLDAAEGRGVDWDALLAGYPSAVDFPAQHFYRELMARYPEAKVILTVRDPEGWYASTRDTIYAISESFPNRLVAPFLPVVGGVFRLTRVIWRGLYGGRFLDKEHALAIYHRHIAEVKAHVPPERLLVFDVKQGWEPLCAFLGVPAPAAPFPRLNDTPAFRKRVRMVQAVSWAVLLLPVLVIAGLVAALWPG